MTTRRMSIFAVLAMALSLAGFAAQSALPAGKDGGTAYASVTDVAFKDVKLNGLVVADEHIKVDKKQRGCAWYKDFKNSSDVLGSYHGSPRVGYPDHNGYLCKDSHSPTG